MADQQRKVSLIFEANTSQAKQNINDLVQTLQKVQSMPTSLIDSTGIKEASRAAMELQGHIQKAINIDTGKLDLSRFATSLKTSGKDLDYFRSTLTRIGPEGNTAFQSMVRSINNAQVSTVRLTKGMQNFLTTMKNTVKWQISSSLMHGAISSIQQAIGYAKALDASLTNIRIVTGQSSEQMARFAVEANRAARALSTTTTKYADAALIFYQQGLGDKAVKERTEAVIKMANVTGEAAADVSSYMTAIWNNFANGSKELEYYEDVITKLGAATAASSKEIAGGLEKFAAIGNTIGLSYEYATSMIATIVDKTRQSEDVVGTALKTILARIQGLNLGETLEDGTSLNKYSQALANVGVNIKDASGQLKDMDAILDELGAKWGTLSKDTQIAVAQVVGGVRQYNQIISLMDNWGSFKSNVNLAEISTGTLDKQAEIYAESWEAARNRVKAAAEGIYDALLDEKVFIQMDTLFTGLLNGINGVVKGMGGMIPIITTIGSLFTAKFAKEMPTYLNNLMMNISVLSGKANNNALTLQQEATRQAANMRDYSAGDAKVTAEYEALRRVSAMREQLIKNQHQMSAAERESYEAQIRNEEALGRILVERQAALGLAEKETAELQKQVALRTAQAQADNFNRSFNDSKGQYQNSEAYDNMNKQVRDEFEAQLQADDQKYAKLKAAQMGTGKTQRERQASKQQLTNQEMQELQDIEYRRRKYGMYGQRTDAYYDEIENRTKARYQGKVRGAASALSEAAAIQQQKNIATQEMKTFMSSDSFSGAENKTEILKQKLKELKSTLELLDQDPSVENVARKIEDLGNKADLTEDDVKTITQALDVMGHEAEQSITEASQKFSQLGGSAEDAKLLIESGKRRGAAEYKGGSGQNQPPAPKVEDFSKKIAVATQAMGTLMSTYSAFNAVAGAYNTVMDENATAMEKLGAIVGALFTSTMALNSITQLATSLKLKNTLMTYAGITAEAKDVTMKVLLAEVTKTLSNRIKELWVSMGPLGWAILAVVAAVTALTTAMVYFNSRGTSTEKKIKELKEQSEGLAAAQENLKQSISDIESAWDNYQKMVDILNSCTTGTEAWNKALRDVNQSILDIIKTEPALAGFIQYDANGQAYLGGADYERYIAEKNRMSQLLQAEKALVDADLSELQNQKYLFGSQEQQASLMKFWKEAGSTQNWTTNIFENLSKLFTDVFQGNEEEFKRYLDTSNLTQALGTDEVFSINADDIYRYIKANNNPGFNIKDGAEVNTLQSEWLNALNAQSYNEQVRKIAYTDIFSNMAGYNADNIYLYGQELEKLVETEKAAIADLGFEDILRQYENYAGYQPNELSIKDGKIIDSAGNEIQGLTEASMRAAVALGNVSRNSEALVGIITKENAALEKMSPYAQSIVRAGNAIDGSIPVSSTTFKAQEAVKEYDPIAVERAKDFTPIIWYDTLTSGNGIPQSFDTYLEDYNKIIKLQKTNEFIDGQILRNQLFTPNIETPSSYYRNQAKTFRNDLNLWDSTIGVAESHAEDYWSDYLGRFDIKNASTMIEEAKGIEEFSNKADEAKKAYEIASYDAQRATLEANGMTAEWDEDFLLLRTRLEELYPDVDFRNREVLALEEARDIQDSALENLYTAQDGLKLAIADSDFEYTAEQIKHILEYANLMNSIDIPETLLKYSSREDITSAINNAIGQANTIAGQEATVAAIQANTEELLAQRTANSTALENIDYSDDIKEISKIITNYFNITFEDAKGFVEQQLSETGTVDISKITASFKTTEEDYIAWYESMLDSFGTKWQEFIDSSTNISQDSSFEDIYNYAMGEEGILAFYQHINKSAIEALESIIGTSIADFDLGEDFSGNYYEKVQAIQKLVTSPDSEFYHDYNRESILDLFYPDEEEIQNIYRGENGIQKFLEDFGEYYFSEDELKNLKIDWALIAERIENSIITNQENAFKEWQKGSERFDKAVSYDKETGFTVNEEEAGSQLFVALQETGQLTADNINSFMNSFAEISGGMTDEVLAKFEPALVDLIQETGNAESVFQALDIAIGRAIASGKDLKESDLVEIFKSLGIDTEALGLDLSDLNSTINTAAGSIRKFSASIDGLISTLKAGKTATDKLKKGEEISTEDYQNIVGDLNDKQKQLFARSLNGYIFYGEESDATAIASQVHDAGWESYREGANRIQAAGEGTALADIKNPTEMTRQGYINDYFLANPEAYRDLAIASGIGEFNFDNILASLSSENIKYDSSTGVFADNSAQQNQAPLIAAINALIATMGGFVQGNYAEGSLESQQIAMTSATSTEELERRRVEGQITIGKDGVSQEQYDAAYNQRQLDEYEADFGLDKEELDDFGDTIQKMAESSDDLAKSLKDDAVAADELAKAFKREEKAIASIQSNYEDWIKVAKNKKRSDKDTHDLAKQTKTDLENLMDLSENFFDLTSEKDLGYLTDPETIEKMNDVANGVEGSQQAMMDSIISFKGEALGQSEEIISAFKTMAEEMSKIAAGEEIKIGDAVSVSPALQNALDTAIASLYNANGELAVSVEEANAILGTLGEGAGFDVEAVSAENMIPGETYYTPITEEVPLGADGGSVPAIVGWEPVTSASGSFSGVAYKVTNKKGSYGGGVRGTRRGGSGGGGSRRPQAEKKQSSDKQRYHTVTNQLEDLTDAYDKVSKAADRAFGKSRVKLLREQQAALKDLASTQQDYIDEIESYYKQDLDNLGQVSQYVGFNIEMDENGTITNFDAIQDKMYDMYNSHINDKDEVIDMDEEAWKEYEEEWERIMALIEQYEETQDKRKEALQQLQDYINEIYDLQLEEITYAVEVDIEASDDALEILDYLLNRIEDDAWKAAEAIAYMGEQAATMLDKNNTYNSAIRDILMNHTQDVKDSEGRILQKAQLSQSDVEGFLAGDAAALEKIMGLNGAFTTDEVDNLRDYHNSLIETNESLIELRETMHDKVLESFESFNEEMDKSIDKIDHLSNVTEKYKNIIDIVGKKNLNVSNALIDSLNQAAVEQRINRVDATKTKRDTIAAEIATAEAALADARAKGLEEDAKLWEKTLEEMRVSLDEAEEDFMQSWEDALDSIRQQFEEAVGHAVETLSDALAGPLMGSMEELQDAFDRQNTVAERYLPDYEKIYELNKLNRDITNSIDETDNIKAKQELAALQAEINALEESETQISEYQMENLRRRYELKQAEIALTEAQGAKSQVQMSRDADGNWSYVYTANEDQVAEAEQTYEDRLFAMQEANAEYINAMNDNIIQLEVEMTQKLQEIMLDETLSAEERMAKLQEVTTFYQGQMEYYTGELELVLGENKVLYEEDWTKYSELTGYKISADKDYVDNFNETALSTLTGFQNMEEFQQNFNDAIGHPDSHGLLYDLNVAYDTWTNNTEAAMNAAGTSIQNFADDMAEDVNDIVDASEQATEEIEKMGKTVEETFTDITDAVENWANTYSAKIDEILTKNTALAQSFNQLLQAWSDYGDATTEDATETSEEEPEENSDIGEPADEGPDVPDSVAEKTEKYKKGIAFAVLSHPSSGWGTGNSSSNLTSGKRYDRLKAKGLDPNTVQQQINAYRGKSTDYMKKDSGINFNNWSDRVEALNPYTYKKFAFDTGGYTGDWGEEGRWALLHSKEIVLNKDDTANLLSAVDMIRQISKAIDLNAYSSAGYGNSIIKAGSGMGGTLEQNVHITAEFPNATNREEIYSAFTDIINLASQYANRK